MLSALIHIVLEPAGVAECSRMCDKSVSLLVGLCLGAGTLPGDTAGIQISLYAPPPPPAPVSQSVSLTPSFPATVALKKVLVCSKVVPFISLGQSLWAHLFGILPVRTWWGSC